MPTPTQLRAEITTGPLAAALTPLFDAGEDIAVADALNDATGGLTMLKPVPMIEFAKFAAASGIRQKLRTGQPHATVGAVCDTAIEMLGHLDITFDLNDAATAGMMGLLVAADVISAADAASVVTRCTVPASRYEIAFTLPGARVTFAQIGEARKAAP